MSKSGMMAAVAAAAGLGTAEVENLTIDAKMIATHFPEAAAALRDEGAEAEHNRIAAIEAAHMPGHDAVIAAHKADRSKTGADAAQAVIAAEKVRLAGLKASLADDERKVADLRAAAPGTEPRASGEANPHAAARNLSELAQTYIAEQAAKGITVSVAEAVAHVSKKG